MNICVSRTTELLMFICFTMVPGTHATEIQSFSHVVLRPCLPQSSELSYNGHGELNRHCIPASPVLVIKVDNASPTLLPNTMQTVPPSTQADPETPSHPREVDNGVSRTSGGGGRREATKTPLMQMQQVSSPSYYPTVPNYQTTQIPWS